MFPPIEIMEERLARGEAQLLEMQARGLAGWPTQLAEAGIDEMKNDFAKLAMISDLAGALSAALEQIDQMKRMFDDEDGTIAEAVEVGEAALEAWHAVRAKDRRDYYGTPKAGA